MTVDDLYADPSVTDDPPDATPQKLAKFRSVFVSDTHFGTTSNCAGLFVRFLNKLDYPEFFYLAGDIIDAWRWGKRAFTEKMVLYGSEQTAFQKLSRLDRHGTKIPYIPGNHDAIIRLLIHFFSTIRFSPHIRFVREIEHVTADGRRFLIMHGDEFDRVVRLFKPLSSLATRAYEGLALLSIQIDKWRRNYGGFNSFLNRRGYQPSYSFAHALKTRSDHATYTPACERAILRELFKRNAEIYERRKTQPEGQKEPYISGIGHGHFHNPGERWFVSPKDEVTGEFMGPPEVVLYDFGHWTGRPTSRFHKPDEEWRAGLKVPTCTALVEHMNGRLELVQFINDEIEPLGDKYIHPVPAGATTPDVRHFPARPRSKFFSFLRPVSGNVPSPRPI